MDTRNALQLAKMRNASQETREHAFKMEAVRKNLMPPADKEKKLRESCEGFESIFIQKMWEQMRATIPESGLLKGREEKFWQSMYDQELAKTMAGAGGIGLADMMYEQLSRNLRSASKHAADAAGGQPSGFAAELAPAPLIPAAAPKAKTAAANAETPVQGQKTPAPAGLYSEARQPDAPGDPRNAAPPSPAASGVAAANATAEDGSDTAITVALNALRAAHQAGSPINGQQALGPKGLSLGARPPLPPMQGDGSDHAPGQQARTTYISTLSKPVHRPASGKRAVLPRAGSGPRVPTGRPVNRNLPFARQAAQQNPPQNPLQDAPEAQSGIQRNAAQLATDAGAPGSAAPVRPQTGG